MGIAGIKGVSINQRLLISYILVIVIPITAISVIIYNYTTDYLEERVTESVLATSAQITENLDTFFTNMAKITEMPYYDKELNNILDRRYSVNNEMNEYQKVEDYNQITQNFFSKLFLLNKSIETLYLTSFVNDRVYYKGYRAEYSREESDLKNEQWFRNIVSKGGKEVIIGIHDEFPSVPNTSQVITIGRLIVKPFTNEKQGVFLINIKPEKLEELYKETRLTPGTRQLIIDENNRIVYSKLENEIGTQIDPDIIKIINSKGTNNEVTINNTPVFIISDTSRYSFWKVINIIPRNELFSDAEAIREGILLIGIALVLLSVLVSFIIAGSITKPIVKLNNQMKLVEQGDFSVNIEGQRNDEVGQLSKTFNKMILQINELIQKIKIDGENKRISELQALQSQINPHFMYNTLNVIKWMAQMQAADNITQAVDSLIYLLNFSAKTTAEFIPISEELEFVKNYISIMRLRYYNKFEVIYEIEDSVYKYKTLKFILQPFIENAIFHGFDKRKSGYHLRIKAFLENGSVCFIINDDGSGIAAQDIPKILNKDIQGEKGFNSIGISNVVGRIKLHFGQQYKVDITSRPEVGTSIFINIPQIGLDDEITSKEPASV
ncbi:cache domain-containing sensor histidine kinase [Ruminiclostridium cellobioparum]|uniref:Integral membrane sensor signal transduction histidine kinase n=1 Tax=Ruminiclostridium cellobioparum subsp. termitidis CT1112 TaxID=1195236 RepID=S0FF19_RUMCE|nr:sensor histidine kinase [Ruminiclostridium cellobioparum]EMS69205.1 integral membrane sensor signal transduction histidine kinase [Ruminiclostridium cellobioparum subsp. termitidis CT1112]